MHLRRLLWVAIAGLLTVNSHGFSAEADFKVVSAGFENGLSAWQATGEAHLETNQPLAGRIYAVKKPKDFLNDPLHANDYLARWYAQSLEAALDPAAAAISPAPENSGNNVHQIKTENESP
jgi:hypothetical protein